MTATVQSFPPTTTRSELYVANRPPLRPNPLLKLPIGVIEPRGWLRGQLERLRSGLVGRLPEVSPWCRFEDSAWSRADGEGRHGWEELPYWLKGYGDLGYVLQDAEIISQARRWIDAVLAGQESDGYFGPRQNRRDGDLWPNMVMLNVFQSCHEATGDRRLLEAMSRYFRWQLQLPVEKLLPGSWQKIRGGDNLESVLWLYNRTGEPWLLELAERLHTRTAPWEREVADWHGVNICQGFREPALYYQLSGRRAHLDAAERNYQVVLALYGQAPGGMFGADEDCRPGYYGPRQGAETCSMVEFMRSHELLLAITGDPLWADRCEEIAFNSLPAAMTPDLRALHYLTAPNGVQLDRHNKAPAFENGGCMLAYSPHHYRCCQHNVAMGWPYYAEHLWMATNDHGLAAVLYADCAVEARAGAGGQKVRIVEQTDYPFDEKAAFELDTDQPVAFPLYLRIPAWAQGARVHVNGQELPVTPRPAGYVRIERAWRRGDTVELHLPMRVEVTRWRTAGDAVSVRRGPLWYSLEIGERWERFGGTEDWPAWEVFPTTPWNYGLELSDDHPEADFKLVRRPGPVSDQPFTPADAPLALETQGRRIPAWQMDRYGLVGELQSSPARTSAPLERLRLIPMGCARLRLTVLPTVRNDDSAFTWLDPPAETEPVEVQQPYRPDAAEPRLSWWPHRGRTVWATWDLGRPEHLSCCEVQWLDDGAEGRHRPPKRWCLYYLQDGAWWGVPAASAFTTRADGPNRVTFEPVETTQLAIEAELQPGCSAGIVSWSFGQAPERELPG